MKSKFQLTTLSLITNEVIAIDHFSPFKNKNNYFPFSQKAKSRSSKLFGFPNEPI